MIVSAKLRMMAAGDSLLMQTSKAVDVVMGVVMGVEMESPIAAFTKCAGITQLNGLEDKRITKMPMSEFQIPIANHGVVMA